MILHFREIHVRNTYTQNWELHRNTYKYTQIEGRNTYTQNHIFIIITKIIQVYSLEIPFNRSKYVKRDGYNPAPGSIFGFVAVFSLSFLNASWGEYIWREVWAQCVPWHYLWKNILLNVSKYVWRVGRLGGPLTVLHPESVTTSPPCLLFQIFSAKHLFAYNHLPKSY